MKTLQLSWGALAKSRIVVAIIITTILLTYIPVAAARASSSGSTEEDGIQVEQLNLQSGYFDTTYLAGDPTLYDYNLGNGGGYIEVSFEPINLDEQITQPWVIFAHRPSVDPENVSAQQSIDNNLVAYPYATRVDLSEYNKANKAIFFFFNLTSTAQLNASASWSIYANFTELLQQKQPEEQGQRRNAAGSMATSIDTLRVRIGAVRDVQQFSPVPKLKEETYPPFVVGGIYLGVLVFCMVAGLFIFFRYANKKKNHAAPGELQTKWVKTIILAIFGLILVAIACAVAALCLWWAVYHQPYECCDYMPRDYQATRGQMVNDMCFSIGIPPKCFFNRHHDETALAFTWWKWTIGLVVGMLFWTGGLWTVIISLYQARRLMKTQHESGPTIHFTVTHEH